MNCSACGEHIGDELNNALPITLYGGYGMFFDTDFTTKPDVYELVLCHECAHKLVGSSPFLTRLLKGGHFHGWTMEDDIHNPLNEDILDFHKDWGKL